MDEAKRELRSRVAVERRCMTWQRPDCELSARSPDLATGTTEGLHRGFPSETCGRTDGGVVRPTPNIP